MSHQSKQVVYLALAVCGVVGTWYFNLQMEDMSTFFDQVWDTPVSSSLMMDLNVVFLMFVFFMITEIRRLGMKMWIPFVLLPLTLGVAIAFTFPLFLFLRERAIEKQSIPG